MNGKLDRVTACRGCGKEIAFIKTEKGKTMPVDPEPVWVKQEKGGKPFIQVDGNYVYGWIAGDAEDDPDSGRFRMDGLQEENPLLQTIL